MLYYAPFDSALPYYNMPNFYTTLLNKVMACHMICYAMWCVFPLYCALLYRTMSYDVGGALCCIYIVYSCVNTDHVYILCWMPRTAKHCMICYVMWCHVVVCCALCYAMWCYVPSCYAQVYPTLSPTCHTVVCCATLNITSHRIVSWHCASLDTILHYDMLWHVIRDAMRCNATCIYTTRLQHGSACVCGCVCYMSCCVTSPCTTLYVFMIHYMLSYAMWWYVSCCYILTCLYVMLHVTSCHAMLHSIVPYFTLLCPTLLYIYWSTASYTTLSAPWCHTLLGYYTMVGMT